MHEFSKILQKNFAGMKKCRTFALAFERKSNLKRTKVIGPVVQFG
jgi:hypothetical protein